MVHKLAVVLVAAVGAVQYEDVFSLVVVVIFIGIKHIYMFITLYIYKVFTSVTYKQHYNHDNIVREKYKIYFQNANYIDYHKLKNYVYIFH